MGIAYFISLTFLNIKERLVNVRINNVMRKTKIQASSAAEYIGIGELRFYTNRQVLARGAEEKSCHTGKANCSNSYMKTAMVLSKENINDKGHWLSVYSGLTRRSGII